MKTAILLAIAAAQLCFASTTPLSNVDLVFRDSDIKDDYDRNEWNQDLARMTFNVQPATDDRTDPNSKQIGFCEDKNLPVTTKTNIAAFVTSSVQRVLQQTGIHTSPTSGTKLYLNVRDFFVQEGGVYAGRISIDYTVINEKGDTLYFSPASSTSKRWGRTYKLDNYMETLTGALFSNVDIFLKNHNKYQQSHLSK